MLLDLAINLRQNDERVVLLGTPGLAYEALSTPRGIPIVFLGEDNSVSRRLVNLNRKADYPISIRNNGLRMQPQGVAGIVILDPPWYLDYIRPMLATAASLCRVYGHVIISLPPDGTRASAAEDKVNVLEFSEALGLRVMSDHALELTYETPFFENNALGACGLRAKDYWRQGDLLVLRKMFEIDGTLERLLA